MDTRTRVWVPRAGPGEQQWVAAEILAQSDAGVCTCMTMEGDEVEVAKDQLEMREVLPDDGVDDLTSLKFLHEPAILNNLLTRFNAANGEGKQRKLIYTYCGHICIAVNPFEWLRELYTVEVMQQFRGSLHEENEPHIYAAAEAAFSSMMTGVKDGIGDQSILVSGESGAGKTESVKIMMHYLAQAAGRQRAGGDADGGTDVATSMLRSNPLLEAFGNARTLRNDNSSRFGKFTRILFDAGGAIVGSRIDVYLLEKSRVVTQTAGERSFHFFYDLAAAPERRISAELRAQLGLMSAEQHLYLSKSGCTTIKGLNDTEEFDTVAEAMGVIGMKDDELVDVCRTIAGVLALGHIEFQETQGASGDLQAWADEDAMQLHSQLFSVEPSALAGALISRQICARDEWYTIQLTKAQAEDSRDGLAKALYERLFNWLVSRINVSTAPQNPTWVKSTIGILDIFGFESFKHNSFEQLLINFANEKLQQQFTWYVFKLEQAEYEKEGIVWNQVDFQDNQPVLDTIEGFGGVLSLLDEESYLQKGKDENFMTKLRKARVRKVAPSPGAKAEPILSFSRMGEANFIIRHYAGFVDYDSVGFREKNKDALHPDMVAMMTASADPFVVSLFPNEAAASDTGKGRSGRLPTLASQFKTSLNELVAGINETAVHYVRCIKPNQHASSNEFDLQGVHEQLRCQGILEAIRIARAAYPNRLVHGEIISRYAFCLFDESLAKPGGAAMEDKIRKTKGEMKRKAEMLMQALNLDTSTYQIGRTKVFFRRVALEELEASRGRVVDRKLTKLQAAVRSMIYRKRFLRMRFAAITVQARGRAYNERRSFVRLRLALIKIQCVGRMIAARNEMYRRKYGVAATKIQTRARLNLYRRRYVSLRFAALIAQREGRRALAMRRYVIAKKEAVEEAKMVNIVNRLQERLAEEMRCREEAEAKLAESATGGPDGEDSPLRVSRSSRASSILSDDGPSDELVEQLEARIKELEESLVRKTEDLEHAHRQLQEQGQELAGAQIEMAAMATAMSSGAGASSDGAQDLAGAVATQREVVVNAVAAARAELQLRLDSQDAELKASRVARMQATNRLNELERSENSRTKRLERELRSVRSELEALNSEREAADVSLRDVHVRSLEKQMAIDRAEADSAKAAANSADQKLTLQQTEMLDVTCTHEDVAALLKQITALNKRSTTQNAELERLRAESLQSATMLADANKQVRLARMQAPAQDGDGIEAAEAEAADKLELTKQLDAMRADAEAAAEAAESANARAEQIQAAEALRASQMAVQIQQQQTEVELLRQDQADLGQKLAVAVAEAAAASAAAGGGASVQEAVAAAKSAVTSASDTRVDQLEQQIQSKDAELLSAVARYEHSEQELKDLRAAQASLEHGSGADKERFEALEKEVALQASQLEARQTELDDLRRLHADQAMELVVAQQEKDVATAQSLSVSAGEQAAKAMAELMKDSKVQDLESQLESKQTQLDELQTKCSALREQLSAAGQQDEHRAELAVQNQRQQDELHNMRLQQVEMGKKFAEMAGEVAAASQASADPSAVLEIVKQARDAATSAAQEQVGGYETQLKELQQQISGKDAEIKALESSARKVADEVTSAKLGAKIGAEKQAALLAQKELLEEKLAMAAAETQRLQEAKAEAAVAGGDSGDVAELSQQLGYVRAELDAERKAHEQVRENLARAEKSAGDMQLLTHSPVRGGGKKAEEELKRKEAVIEAQEKALEVSRKQGLDADRKQAGQVGKMQSLKDQLEASNQKVKTLVSATVSMTQEVSRLEDSLGMSMRGVKQSSRDMGKRLSNLTARLRDAAGHETRVGKIEKEMVHLRAKLQDADVETLFAKHREDQKVLLQMSNTTVKSVLMKVHSLRREVVTLQKALPPLAEVEPDSATCWNIPRHVVDRAAFAHSLADAMIDTANLRKNLNDLTWELCKPGYGPADVAEFEANNQVSGVEEQAPNLYGALRPTPDRKGRAAQGLATPPRKPATPPAGGGAATSAMEKLVQQEIDKVWDSRTKTKKRQVIEDFEMPGVLGYIRRCFQSCDGADMSRMQRELVEVLEMMEAAKKIESMDWDSFPPPM